MGSQGKQAELQEEGKMCGPPCFRSVCGFPLQKAVYVIGLVELTITVIVTIANVVKYSKNVTEDGEFCEGKDVCIGPIIKHCVFDAFFGILCSILLFIGARIQLVQFAYFKKVLDRKGRKQGGEESEEEDDVERDETPSKRRRRNSGEEEEAPSKRARVEASEEQASTSSAVSISEARLKQFMALLQRCIAEKNMAESLELHVVRAFFAKTKRKSPFSDAEIDACIEKMSDDNKLMRSEDTIFVI